jgi:hypothetical protein
MQNGYRAGPNRTGPNRTGPSRTDTTAAQSQSLVTGGLGDVSAAHIPTRRDTGDRASGATT